MLDLKFWFIFFGFLVLVFSLAAIISPEKLRRILKKYFRDKNLLRTISIWNLTIGPMAVYSGWMAPSYLASLLIILIGFAIILEGILLFFCTKWIQHTFLKPFFKFSDFTFRLFGSLKFVAALCFIYYGMFFL